jgi:FAD-linked sulfhydryl oxidase
MLKPTNLISVPAGGWHYTQPGTGVTFKATCLAPVLSAMVWRHRKGNPQLKLDVADGWYERWLSEVCVQNTHIECADAVPPEASPLVIEGRKRWEELHTYAGAYPDSPSTEEVESAKRWMNEWRSRIPGYSHCKCRQKFAELELMRPAALSSRHAFVRWAIDIHNDVNLSLGKPLFEG